MTKTSSLKRAVALSAALAACVAVGTTLSPQPAEAGGGLSLMDRVMLTGTVRSFGNGRCTGTQYTVPEGRRFFLTQVPGWTSRDETPLNLGGVRLFAGRRRGAGSLSFHFDYSTPLVFPAGTAMTWSCNDGSDQLHLQAIGYEF